MKTRELKDLLYEHVARIGKALASPKRLELIELLAQGEKTVEDLAAALAIDIRLASAHLRALKAAQLVVARREGRYVRYRLSDDDVAALWVRLREVAEAHLVELRLKVDTLLAEPKALASVDRKALLERARRGEVVVIDVRPEEEYARAHLPFARSLPLPELRRRLDELPRDREIVAYCRGPYCLLSQEAVQLLRKRGFHAGKILDGVAEWAAAGLPLQTE